MTTLTAWPDLSDKGYLHGYLEFYDLLLAGRDVRRVLELGVDEGGSLDLWSRRWPDADIVGVDVRDGTDGRHAGRLLIGDAYTVETVAAVGSGFDLIVDDGPHNLPSFRFAVQHYTPLLAAGGVLVVEDVPNPSMFPAIRDAVPEPLRRWSYGVDLRAGAPDQTWWNHLLYVVDTRCAI